MDNQLSGASYPVAVFPAKDESVAIANDAKTLPCIHALLVQSIGDGNKTLHIPYCGLMVQPLYMRADEDLVAVTIT